MNKIQEIIHFIISNYPTEHRYELSNARLTKIVYLSDWRHVLMTDTANSISGIKWYFHNYGPYVDDVRDNAVDDFFVKKTNASCLYITDVKNTDYKYGLLKESERSAILKVIELTKKLNFSQFIDFVYSTYPIKTSSRYTYLDLQQKKEERLAILSH